MAANLSNLRTVYLALHLAGGHIGLPILILTYLLSKNVVQHPTLVNFWITWVIYSVSYCLLIYGGPKALEVSEIPSNLCRIQSVMIHGVPPMAAVAGLQVVIQVWLAVRDPLAQKKHEPSSSETRHRRRLLRAFILLVPYFAFLIFAIPSAVVGSVNLQSLNGSNGLYCTLHLAAFGQFGIPVFCSIMLFILLSLQGIICVKYFRSWRANNKHFPLADRKISPSLLLRILLFNLYAIVSLMSGIAFLSDYLRSWSFMVQAALPLAAFIVFGTQREVLRAWCFWRKRPETTDKLSLAYKLERADSWTTIASSRPPSVISCVSGKESA